MILYKNPNKERSKFNDYIRIIVSSILVIGFINILLDSLWLNILYGKAYGILITTRIIPKAIMLPIYTVLVIGLQEVLMPIIKKELYEKED